MIKAQHRKLRMMSPRALRLSFYFQLILSSLVIVFLFTMFIVNIIAGVFDFLILSFVAASMLTLLIFLDILVLLVPRGLITNIFGIVFSFISFGPILVAVLSPQTLRSEFASVAYAFFYCHVYGMWNLFAFKEQEEGIEKEHPQVMILLMQRGFFFLAYAQATMFSSCFFKALSVESILLKINFLLIGIAAILPGFKYMFWFVKFQFYLHKTKKGRRLWLKSLTDQWKKTVNERLVIKILWYLALPVAVLSFYAGSVSIYYFGLITLNLERLFVGLLAIGGGVSVLSYHWTRTGSLSRFTKALSSPPRKKPTLEEVKERIKDLEKWCSIFFGAVIALIGLLRYTGIRTFAIFQGVEINDMTLVYIDIFWLLSILIPAEILLSLIKTRKQVDLSKISRHVDYLYMLLWYFLAVLTGSFAYALGIPPILDAIIVVAFLTIVTVYRLYALYFWK